MSKLQPRIISGGASILLDSMRLGASLTVVFGHALYMWYPNLMPTRYDSGNAPHAAVVVFFALSGYVIAHTTTSNNRGPRHYAQARLSRLYSILLPALAFTALAEFVLLRLAPELAVEFTRGTSWPRYFITGGFLNELWFQSAAPPINGPLWSLSFEFWYYIIFGLWFYRRSGRAGLLLPIGACLIAGPKIILMLPIWLAGVVAYRLPRPQLRASQAWLLAVAGLLGAAIAVEYLPPFPFGIGDAPLFYAGQFLTDWVVGLFVAGALWILPTPAVPTVSTRLVNWIRLLADLTFPIYVLHQPALILWRAIFGQRLNDPAQLLVALTSVLAVVVVLSLLLERQRPAWTRFFKWLFRPRGVQPE